MLIISPDICIRFNIYFSEKSLGSVCAQNYTSKIPLALKMIPTSLPIHIFTADTDSAYAYLHS